MNQSAVLEFKKPVNEPCLLVYPISNHHETILSVYVTNQRAILEFKPKWVKGVSQIKEQVRN